MFKPDWDVERGKRPFYSYQIVTSEKASAHFWATLFFVVEEQRGS